MWQKAQDLSAKIWSNPYTSFASIFLLAGGGFEDILNMIMCAVQSLAFYGAVFGLIFFGLLKIWEIFFPEAAGQTRNYIKSLVMGVIVISMAFWLVSTVFEALGMKVGSEISCSK